MEEANLHTPDYRRIFLDIIEMKYPEKKEICKNILNKKELLTLDVIHLNHMVFGIKDKETFVFNQSHRFYNEKAIAEILEYQKKNNLSNSETARHFKMSRNTITKWKKLFDNSIEKF